MNDKEIATELTDDIEVIGPGQMLAEARLKLGLTTENVAVKLNFREALVRDIENEKFDQSLPATYNRGYLRNYAKLVKISEEDVLNSYEMLGIAKAQGAEMQSFSQITKKQTHNNILMWTTYLIIALVIGSSAMWWLQGNELGSAFLNEESESANLVASTEQTTAIPSVSESASNTSEISENAVNDTDEATNEPTSNELLPATINQEQATTATTAALEEASLAISNDTNPDTLQVESVAEDAVEVVAISSAVFNFSGDCWVNIYDATGERIAWGIKKAGYEMNISGVPPLSITLGKPELVEILFEGSAVDMSTFSKGNIAKFTLPLNEE